MTDPALQIIRAFELVLERFAKKLLGDASRAEARAARIIEAAGPDPEKRRILDRHEAARVIEATAERWRYPRATRERTAAARPARSTEVGYEM